MGVKAGRLATGYDYVRERGLGWSNVAEERHWQIFVKHSMIALRGTREGTKRNMSIVSTASKQQEMTPSPPLSLLTFPRSFVLPLPPTPRSRQSVRRV